MCTQVAYELHVPRTSGMILDPAAPRWNAETRHFLTQTIPDVL